MNHNTQYDLPELHPLFHLALVLGAVIAISIGVVVAFTPWVDFMFKGFGI